MFLSFRFKSKRFIIVAFCVLSVIFFAPLFVSASNNSSAKIVYLTFDDGPSYVTPRLLDILSKNGVKATFFVTGQYEEYFPVLKQIYDDGHLIALHSYTHNFSEIYSDTEAFWDDIGRLDQLIYEQTGTYAEKIIRFPGGSSNTVSSRQVMKELITQCAEKEYSYIDWTIDVRDSVGGAKSPEYIVKKALDQIDEVSVAVILMHDGPGQKTAPEAADALIKALKEKGYVFDTLDNLTEEVHHSLP